MLCYKACLVQVVKKILCNLGAFVVRGAAELVKIDMEPVVDFCMLCKIVVAQLPWSLLLFQGSGLGCCTILVGTADIKGVVPAKPAEPGKNIS